MKLQQSWKLLNEFRVLDLIPTYLSSHLYLHPVSFEKCFKILKAFGITNYLRKHADLVAFSSYMIWGHELPYNRISQLFPTTRSVRASNSSERENSASPSKYCRCVCDLCRFGIRGHQVWYLSNREIQLYLVTLRIGNEVITLTIIPLTHIRLEVDRTRKIPSLYSSCDRHSCVERNVT